MGDDEAEDGADDDRGERDEGRLEQQAGLHRAALEADRAENADLLAAFDDGAGGDDAERGDTDDEAERKESFDEAVHDDVCADRSG